MIKPFSTLTMRRRSVLAAPALLLPERAFAWAHGRGGSSPPPPPPGNNVLSETAIEIFAENGANITAEA